MIRFTSSIRRWLGASSSCPNILKLIVIVVLGILVGAALMA